MGVLGGHFRSVFGGTSGLGALFFALGGGGEHFWFRTGSGDWRGSGRGGARAGWRGQGGGKRGTLRVGSRGRGGGLGLFYGAFPVCMWALPVLGPFGAGGLHFFNRNCCSEPEVGVGGEAEGAGLQSGGGKRGVLRDWGGGTFASGPEVGEGGETEGAGLDGVTWSGGGKRELSRDGGGGVGMLGEALIGGTSGHRGALPVVLAQGLLWLL